MAPPPEALPRTVLERRLRRSRTLNLCLGAAAIAGLLFGAVQCTAVGAGKAAGSQGEAASAEAGSSSTGDAAPVLERRDPSDPMSLGDVDAPVVLNEWIDMRCPYCAVVTRDTLPAVIAEYVDSGKVRIEFHDVAFFGEESIRAAAAARAAGEQGKYHEFVRAVYAAAPEGGHPDLTSAELVGFAREVGIRDLDRFERELASDELREEVGASTRRAQELGVTSVPFFFADGQALSGAQSLEAFQGFLDAALDRADAG